MDTIGQYCPHLGLFVVISVRIVSHVFTKDISRVFVRGNDIRRLPFSVPVNKYKNNIYSVLRAHKLLCHTPNTLFTPAGWVCSCVHQHPDSHFLCSG